MFCRYCGSQINDDAVFCEKCGKQLDEKNTSNHDFHVEKRKTDIQNHNEKGDFIKTVKYSPSRVGIFLNFILAVIGIAMVASASNLKFYDSMYKDKDLLIVMGVIIIIAAGISLIIDLIIISINSNIYCSAYENKIIGRASNSSFSMNTVNFTLGYDEIDNVIASNKMITISANGINYIVYAESAEEAEDMVNIINSHTKSEENTIVSNISKRRWKCVQCGSIITEEPCPNCHCGITFWKCCNCGRKNRGTLDRCAWCDTPSNMGLYAETKELKFCEICDKGVTEIYYVRIKDHLGIRYGHVCDDCMKKYNCVQIEEK